MFPLSGFACLFKGFVVSLVCLKALLSARLRVLLGKRQQIILAQPDIFLLSKQMPFPKGVIGGV